jgi:arabinofuranosyltransferase
MVFPQIRAYPRKSAAVAFLVLGVAVAVLALHAYHFLPFIADDALISLRYSLRLLGGHGLTWNPGERVEGYSNLLWVLCCAALGLTGMDLVTATRVLGFAGIAAAIAAIVYAHRPTTFKSALPILLTLLFLPLAAPMAVWAIGGMEQPLVAGLLAWAIVLCYGALEEKSNVQRPMSNVRIGASANSRSLWLPGFLFALLCLTRLDGALFTIVAVAVFLILGRGSSLTVREGRGSSPTVREGLEGNETTEPFLTVGLLPRKSKSAWRRAVTLATLPVLFTLLQIAFRRAYYGEWVPNTALVKFTPSLKHALDGWAYIRAGAFPLLPLTVIASGAVVISFIKNFKRPRMFLLTMMLVAWTAYIITIGGDIFPAWRHFVPLVVLLVLMAATGAEWIAAHARPVQLYATSAALVLLLGVFVFLQSRDSENLRAISERWEWDGRAVGLMLKQAFGKQQPLMAIDPAGCLPYWSELPSLDMLGLNDYYLPRHPPPGVGQGAIGHELGDGKYVLDRQPDLVIFLLPTGNDRGYFLSGRQMQQDARFFRDYTLVRFAVQAPQRIVSRIWVRRYSVPIGIRQNENQIDIPAFLLNQTDSTVAYLNAASELVVSSSCDAPAEIASLEVPPGRWRVHAEGQTAALRVRIFRKPQGSTEADRMRLDAPLPAVLDLPQGGAVRIQVFPETEGAVEIKQLQLTRIVE